MLYSVSERLTVMCIIVSKPCFQKDIYLSNRRSNVAFYVNALSRDVSFCVNSFTGVLWAMHLLAF